MFTRYKRKKVIEEHGTGNEGMRVRMEDVLQGVGSEIGSGRMSSQIQLDFNLGHANLFDICKIISFKSLIFFIQPMYLY